MEIGSELGRDSLPKFATYTWEIHLGRCFQVARTEMFCFTTRGTFEVKDPDMKKYPLEK